MSKHAMASSRIFVKGLPPSISEDEFKKHFGATSAITDAKLISHRRIGYVGYKTPEDAAKAVKYFNRSFIRMSKIGVEVARPISDSTLPVSRKTQREQVRENAKDRKIREADTVPDISLNAATKRKRDEVDESDPKLKEFLEVMQPASRQNKWDSGAVEDLDMGPPTKLQARELPEDDSDGEYEVVPKKPRKSSPPPLIPAPTKSLVTAVVNTQPLPDDVNMVDAEAPDTTDDDWLRNRTNRLLDLMDPEDIVAPSAAAPVSGGSNGVATTTINDSNMITQDTVQDHAVAEDTAPEDEVAKLDSVLEAIKANGRLFVRNLPYTASEDDLRQHFEQYGTLQEIHLPLDAAKKSKGFVLVQYNDPDAAAEAYHNLDGETFQGRLLHILPAAGKREKVLNEFEISKLPLKKQKQIKQKADASSTTFNWNSLFMNQDAVNSAIADRLGVSKGEMLDPTSSESGVKQAIAETQVIQESKAYFAKHGVDLDAFKRRERGDTAILVKNFPYGMSLEDLRKLFEESGQVLRVLMPPTATIAIVEFADPAHARAAFGSLAYRRMKDSVLFLEKAPKNLFTSVSSSAVVGSSDQKSAPPDAKLSTSDLLEPAPASETVDTTSLFVRNLNFTTTSDRLTEIFQPLGGFMSARVKTKTDPKKPGQVLSMGFGFLEFRTKAQAQAALKAMDGYVLDDHKLIIKASHKGLDAAEERRKEDNAKKQSGKSTKIIIKNLPFQANKKEVRTLFGTYGQLRSVRVPKKFDNTARGFAFAEFITAREAENALEALKDTHFLGRRLVLEYAESAPVDAEEEIEKMQKKVSSQVNKVALQKLTGGGRKKFNMEGDDADGDE